MAEEVRKAIVRRWPDGQVRKLTEFWAIVSTSAVLYTSIKKPKFGIDMYSYNWTNLETTVC